PAAMTTPSASGTSRASKRFASSADTKRMFIPLTSALMGADWLRPPETSHYGSGTRFRSGRGLDGALLVSHHVIRQALPSDAAAAHAAFGGGPQAGRTARAEGGRT